jgi:hypothetical protein
MLSPAFGAAVKQTEAFVDPNVVRHRLPGLLLIAEFGDYDHSQSTLQSAALLPSEASPRKT